MILIFFFFSSRRRHTRCSRDWSSDVCSSDLPEEKFDAIITNAAGCGSVLKEYPQLFEEEEQEFLERARAFSARVRDVTEFLASIDFNREFAVIKARATYQDPCHLGHAQRIWTAPRRLLAAVPGLELVEIG